MDNEPSPGDVLLIDVNQNCTVETSRLERVMTGGKKGLGHIRSGVKRSSNAVLSVAGSVLNGDDKEPSSRESFESLELVKQSKDLVIDTVVENQRGFFMLSYPFFSADSLMPFDPGPWTNKSGQTVYGCIDDFLLPDKTWRWKWKRWYVDMSLDIDDQGWAYSWRFGSNSWHGNHIWFRSFTRRRNWLRLRQKIRSDPDEITEAPFLTMSETIENEDTRQLVIESLLTDLDACRLDREKLQIIVSILSDQQKLESIRLIARHMDQIIAKLQYQDSLLKLLGRIEPLSQQSDTEYQKHINDIINQLGNPSSKKYFNDSKDSPQTGIFHSASTRKNGI